MRQCGRVVNIEGSRITVFPDGARCAGCSGGHCQVARRTVRVINSDGHDLRVSDRVEIGTSFLRGLLDFFLLILLPLLTALLAAFPLARVLDLQGSPYQTILAFLGALTVIGANLFRGRDRELPTVTAVLTGEPRPLGSPEESSAGSKIGSQPLSDGV